MVMSFSQNALEYAECWHYIWTGEEIKATEKLRVWEMQYEEKRKEVF